MRSAKTNQFSKHHDSGARRGEKHVQIGQGSGQVAGGQPTLVLQPSRKQTSSSSQMSVPDIQTAEAALSALNISEDAPNSDPKRCRAHGDDVRAHVYYLLTQKVPVPEIRDQTGVALGTVRKWKIQWASDPETDSSSFTSISNCGRRPKPAIDHRTRERITTRIVSREPLQLIADEEDVCLATVRKWRNEAGLPAAQPAKGVAWSLQSRGKVFSLLKANKPVREISALTGVPKGTIYEWRREAEAHSCSF